jgi:hypothetical protein
MSPVCSYGMGPDCTYSTYIEFFCLEKSRRIKNGKQIIFFWGQYYFFFAIPFRGIDESISGWMTIACIINNFCEVEDANVFMADGVWGGISAQAPCIPPTRMVWQGARKVAQ